MMALEETMFVVVVEFRIVPERQNQFLDAVRTNAGRSLEVEPGCRRFDVCTDPLEAALVFLYEIYESETSFQAHLDSGHYLAFDADTRDWVASKTVRRLTLLP